MCYKCLRLNDRLLYDCDNQQLLLMCLFALFWCMRVDMMQNRGTNAQIIIDLLIVVNQSRFQRFYSMLSDMAVTTIPSKWHEKKMHLHCNADRKHLMHN